MTGQVPPKEPPRQGHLWAARPETPEQHARRSIIAALERTLAELQSGRDLMLTPDMHCWSMAHDAVGRVQFDLWFGKKG